MEVVILATLALLSQRPEVAQAVDAQYGIGPKVELYVRKNTPAEVWQIGATAGPLVQVAITRRAVIRFTF